MKVREVYDYQYDNLSENLTVEFSLKGDSVDSYRVVEMGYNEIMESISNPIVLEDNELEELLEDEEFVIEVIETFFQNDVDNIPEEEIY